MIRNILLHCSSTVKFCSKNLSTKSEVSSAVLKLAQDNFSFKSVDTSFVNGILNSFKVELDFITAEEEVELMKDVEPKLKRQRYQFDHWDDAIHGFKETETVKWNARNEETLKRLRDTAFSGAEQLPHTHILDLSEDGYIKPHVDSVRFCGDTIAGISLLSDSVMRLVLTQQPLTVDIFLPRRSLYIMTQMARYDCTHEILKNAESFFNERKILKGRRVSIICRSSPKKAE